MAAVYTGGSGKIAMAVHSAGYTSLSFQCIDVLGIVAKQFAFLF